MNIDKIKATNIEMTEAIRNFVIDKLSALEKKLERFGESVGLDVEVGKTSHHHHKGEVFRCEINISLPGHVLRVEDIQDDLYQAIVQCKQKADRQVTDLKNKLAG